MNAIQGRGADPEIVSALLGKARPSKMREEVLALQTLAKGLHEGDGLLPGRGDQKLDASEAYQQLCLAPPLRVKQGPSLTAVHDLDALKQSYRDALAATSIPIARQHYATQPIACHGAGTEHFDTYEALDRLCFAHPYPPETLRKYITRAGAESVIARGPQGAIGYYVLGHGVGEPGATNLEILGVTPQAQGQRAGERLLLNLMRRARERGSARCHLEVEASNTKARQLYEKYNFKTIDTLRDWISPGRTAYKMELSDLQSDAMGAQLARWHEDLTPHF